MNTVLPQNQEELLEKVSEGIEEEEESTEEKIKEPYDPTQIQVDPQPMTIFQVMRKIQLKEINMQPDFQRNIVWNEIKQSRLIESILIRIPLPAFYLDALDDNQWLVVDGLQRLWTLDKFYNNNDLKLTGLEFLDDQIGGKTFNELPRQFQRFIEDTHLYLYIIR
ncbi:MAG: DUF262 domain-containing protein [Candidatus Marinimicrobia bacterium]|nr:DUF262 domain-containing protein [Candidatus Neomarinimicrobiota bacterium]